jgi:hypothetical protein
MDVDIMFAANDANGGNAEKYEKLPEETNVAAKMMLAVEAANGESSGTGEGPAKKLRSFERINAVAETLRDQESNVDLRTTFMESGRFLVLENNTLMPKNDDRSYQSSLGHKDPEWKSALSHREEASVIVNVLVDSEDPLRNGNSGGQKDELAVWKGHQSSAYLKAAKRFGHKRGVPFNVTMAEEEQDLEELGSWRRSSKKGSSILDQIHSLTSGSCACTESISLSDDDESLTLGTVVSSVFWGTGMMQMFDKCAADKEDDPSYLSSLYYDDLDWETT